MLLQDLQFHFIFFFMSKCSLFFFFGGWGGRSADLQQRRWRRTAGAGAGWGRLGCAPIGRPRPPGGQTLHYYRCVLYICIYHDSGGTLFNCSWRLWASSAIMESYQGPWGHHWRWRGSFSIRHGLDARTAKRLAKCPNSVCRRKRAPSSLNRENMPLHVQAEMIFSK